MGKRKPVYEVALQGMLEHFAARGWELRDRSNRHLWLVQEAGPGARHEMVLSEGMTLETPVPPGFFAGSCSIFVHFPALEAMIRPALGWAAEDRMPALVLSLMHYAPPKNMYCSSTHLIEIDPANGAPATMRFLEDIALYLEPARQRYADEKILADQAFVPKWIDPLGWSIWRAAYVKSHASIDEWRAYADRLEAQALQVLDMREENVSGDPKIFTGIQELLHGVSQQDAQKLLTVVKALR